MQGVVYTTPMQFKSSLRAETNDVLEIQKADNDLLDKINQLAKALDEGVTTYSEPVGVIKPYAGSSAPTGYLLCEGGEISRTQYKPLFDVIGTTYGSGNGSTTFNLPDLREAYPVGIGTRSSGVTAHDTFTLGQFKDDQMQGHFHKVASFINGFTSGAGVNSLTLSGAAFDTFAGSPTTDGTNGTPRTGGVTRGKGLGLNFIIKT